LDLDAPDDEFSYNFSNFSSMYNLVNYEIYMFFKNCLALMGVPGIMGTYLLDVLNINYGQPK
jgi:hypothetical protein